MNHTYILSFNSLAFWLATLLTLFFIAVLTYIYSNKNIKLTLAFTLLAGIACICAGFFELWDAYLAQHFLAGSDALGVSYRVSRSGWFILTDAWPLWVVPGAAMVLGSGCLLWWIQQKIFSKKLSLNSSLSIPPQQRIIMGISSELVTNQLELDKLKKAIMISNSNLALALDEKQLQFNKAKELATKLKQYEQEERQSTISLMDEVNALKLETAFKAQELTELDEKITLQDQEIQQLRTLVDSIINQNSK